MGCSLPQTGNCLLCLSNSTWQQTHELLHAPCLKPLGNNFEQSVVDEYENKELLCEFQMLYANVHFLRAACSNGLCHFIAYWFPKVYTELHMDVNYRGQPQLLSTHSCYTVVLMVTIRILLCGCHVNCQCLWHQRVSFGVVTVEQPCSLYLNNSLWFIKYSLQGKPAYHHFI